MRLDLHFHPELLLEVYPKADLEEVIQLFTRRLVSLDYYAGGPTRWTKEMDEALHVLKDAELAERLRDQYEREEFKLDEILIPLTTKLILENHVTKLVLVGSGPGRRIPEYLKALDATQGTLYGVDVNPVMLQFAGQNLVKKGEQQLRPITDLDQNAQRYELTNGAACSLTAIFEEGSVDQIHYERLGNHITDDKEWRFGLRSQAVPLLRTGGAFVLCESLAGHIGEKALNEKRIMSPGSKFRTLEDYTQALGPCMRLETDLLRTTQFAGDDYVIAVYRKVAESE